MRRALTAKLMARLSSVKMVARIAVLLLVLFLTLRSVLADRSLRDSLISEYFFLGYPYKLILCFLSFVHGISLSLRQLKRILRQLDLRRRPPRVVSVNRQQVVDILIRVSNHQF